MAENEKYVISKINGFNRVIDGYLVSVKESSNEIKTREEYEDMVKNAINRECSSILNEIKSVNTGDLAKAVCDELFGKSK